MNIDTFRQSLAASEPPPDLDRPLQGLWWDAKGEWDRAHARAQEEDTPESAWVHAYLHRKEGDLANAAYWYRRAGRPMPQDNLDAEWLTIVTELLSDA
jgi:hypothetical protein